MKVGDYVRTKKGYIAQYEGIKKYNNIDGEIEDWFIFDSTIIDEYEDIVPSEINKSYFIKSSPNIIDLIEVGDYVNGNVVKELKNELVIMNTGLIYDDNLYIPIKKIEIKSIVTKEQFEEMEYKCTN